MANLNRYADAIECYKKTFFEFEAPDALTYYNIGRCYMNNWRIFTVPVIIMKATKLDPNLAEAWLGIGITLQSEERWFEATRYIKKRFELDDHNAEFWFVLGVGIPWKTIKSRNKPIKSSQT